MPAADSVPTQRPGVRLEEMDGETLLYRRASRKSIYLNESATTVWKLCDGQRTVQQIIDALGEVYPEAGGAIAADVWYAINGLVREGAIRLVTADGSRKAARKNPPKSNGGAANSRRKASADKQDD
jgi:coenzyme PQQ synthesis protein D (PqqD)